MEERIHPCWGEFTIPLLLIPPVSAVCILFSQSLRIEFVLWFYSNSQIEQILYIPSWVSLYAV